MIQRGPGGGDIYIHQCRKCRRWEHTEKFFCHHDPESASLLSLCLKNIPALNSHNHSSRSSGVSSIHLVDSMWIWTEPHCMRLKLRLTIQADVGEAPKNVTIQQRLPVEFIVRWKQCPDCNREFTNRTWQALVQVRQKLRSDGPKKGLAILETAIGNNADVRKHVISMETKRNGFDFYFLELMHAQKFSSYISKVAPMKVKTTQKMVSEDVRNNTANIKHTVVCDLVPLCRHDLVICDKAASKDGCGAGKLSGRLCLVNKIASAVQLVDAAPTRNSISEAFSDLYADRYWKGEKYYRVIFDISRLVRYIVLDVELCEDQPQHGNLDNAIFSGPQSGVDKYALADCVVVRETDFGTIDETFCCTTHLGNLLTPGDVVLAYDLVSSVLPGADEYSVKNSFNANFVLPDVVIVKKVKGGGEEEEVSDDSKNKNKSSSSASKKKDRRQRKQEKKMRDLEATASRMGFNEETSFSREEPTGSSDQA